MSHKIKRAETYRSWADIEDLANGYETLSQNVEQHQTTAANAFQELYNYIEKIKKEVTTKDEEMTRDIILVKDDIRKILGIYNPERDAEAMKSLGGAQSLISEYFSDKVKIIEH